MNVEKENHREIRSRHTKKKREAKKHVMHFSVSDSGSSPQQNHHKITTKRSKKLSRPRSPPNAPEPPPNADKQTQKELIKSMETAEEKRTRRILKKETKEKRRKERMGWDEDYQNYTNADNPFGDANLHRTFVWTKKLEKEGLANLRPEAIESRNKIKREENRVELAKVKKERLEREQERARKEDEMQELLRIKESAQYEKWETQEDVFQLEQARLRSKIRIQDGRAKPIDLLAKYVNTEDEDLAVEMHEPFKYLNGLNVDDLEDLLVDIRVYIELENGKNLDYWTDITVIVDDELVKLRKIGKGVHGRREGVNEAVGPDVAAIFKVKTHAQLVVLRDQITRKIQRGDDGVDIGYWESLLSQLKAHISRAKLSDRHRTNLRTKLDQLRREQCVGAAEINWSEDEDENEAQSEQFETECDDGRYSPGLVSYDSLERGTIVVEPNDDSERLRFAREQLIGQTDEVMKGMDDENENENENENQALFSVEAATNQTYVWADKYRPRKPRYYNRVHTGFEWNKYNQTHYDMENPPPKIVQGYKFNIFYPDLIDKSVTPSYKLFPCEDDRDFAVLRFYAGPPYEDVAFKIVNREWDCSYKRGFKCQFSKNILQFWFHFKRFRYRR